MVSPENLAALTVLHSCDVHLDTTDEHRGESLHLLQGPDQHVPVHLVGQLLLSVVNLFGHSGQARAQVLEKKKVRVSKN